MTIPIDKVENRALKLGSVSWTAPFLLLVLSGMVFPGAFSHPLTLQTSATRPSNVHPGHSATADQPARVHNIVNGRDIDASTLALFFPHGQIPLLFRTRGGPTLSAAASSAAQSAPSTSSVVINSTGFEGMDQTGATVPPCGLCIPPDVQIAVGPAHIIEMVNLVGEIFSTSGFPVKNFTLSSFFNTGSDFVSDPKVMYDASSGRWFASIIDLTGFNSTSGTWKSGNVKVAASLSSDPTVTNSTTGKWNTYILKFGTDLPDQPILGLNSDKVVVSANDFGPPPLRSSSFIGARYYVLNKNDLVRGGVFAHNSTFGPFPSLASIHPVHSLGSTSIEYMVSTTPTNTPSLTVVQLFSVIGVPGVSSTTVSNTTLSISTLNMPPPGIQPFGRTLDTGDKRVLDAAWFQGEIWYVAEDACMPAGDNQTRACIRFGQIDTTRTSINQDFDFSALGQSFFYPALGIDGQSDLDVIYGFSSAAIYPSLAITGQAVSDPAGRLAPSVTIKTGFSPAILTRYGDYFGAAVDPSSASLVWVAGEYEKIIGLESGWTTWVGSMILKPVYVSASTTALAFAPGSSGTSTVTVNGINGFTGTISLAALVAPTVAGGVTATLSPPSVTLASGGSATSTLTVATTSSTPNGLHNVTVTGTAGSQSHSVLVSIAVTPITATISGFSSITGVTVQTTGTISVDSSAMTLSFSGAIAITATNATTGGPMFSDTYAIARIRLQSISAGAYRTEFLANVAVSPYALASVVTVTLYGPSSTAPGTISTLTFVSRNPDIDGDGVVGQMDFDIVLKSLNCSTGQSCFNPRADLDADGTVDSTDVSILNAAFGAINLMNDFSVSASPSSLSLLAGTSQNSTITLGSTNRFAGPVKLATSPSSASLTASCAPASVTLSAGGTATSICTFASSTGGTYTVSVTGSDGSISHSALLSVTVRDFNITANPTSLTLQQASSNNSTISVAGITNTNFSGNVTLSFTISHVTSKGPSGTITVTLSKTNLILFPNGSAKSILTIKAPTNTNSGLYTITVTATSGSLTHSVVVSVTVP